MSWIARCPKSTSFSGCPGTKSAFPPTCPVSVPVAAYPACTAAASAGYGMVPPNPPLPAACTLRFQLEVGSQTSTWMSESGVGVRRAVTRQNAGRVLNTSAAALFALVGGMNPPAATGSADVTVPCASDTWVRDSQAMGATPAPRVPMSNRRNASTIPRQKPALMCDSAGEDAAILTYAQRIRHRSYDR